MSLGFYFDGARCVGCKSCQVACKDRLNIQKAGARPRRVAHFEVGVFPAARMYHVSLGCNHCDSPACVANCPTGAMYKAEDGTVQHDDAVCIGCKTCASVCPYGAPQFDPANDAVSIKCDSCKPLRDAGMNPVCVDACPVRALDFGEVEGLRAKYGDEVVSDLPCLPASSTTAPNLLIRAKEASLSDEFREIQL